jgi:hypothetical protein
MSTLYSIVLYRILSLEEGTFPFRTRVLKDFSTQGQTVQVGSYLLQGLSNRHQ